jgi:hypothetical protein
MQVIVRLPDAPDHPTQAIVRLPDRIARFPDASAFEIASSPGRPITRW